MPSRWNYRPARPVEAVLEPWKDEVPEQFETVVNQLEQRDVILDNHLSLRKSQGLLAETRGPAASNVLIANCPTETTVTEITTSVTVEAHRILKISGQYFVYPQPLSLDEYATIRVKRDGTTITTFQSGQLFDDGVTIRSDVGQYYIFDTPTPGPHTYTMTMCHIGIGNIEYVPNGMIMRVEDMGPNG